MKTNKFLLTFLVGMLSACGGATASMNFGYELDFEKGYNKNLWFKNDLDRLCADPSIIYCEEDQYYYMYMTSDSLGSTGFNVYRSKQLNYWEELSPAFIPHPYSWGITHLWAPNIIKIENKYYLYYSAYNYTTDRKGISVAVSDTPYGPFHEYEGLDYYGNTITRGDQVFEFGYAAIDAAPFQDDNGDLYLYYAKDQVNSVSECYGVKLLDPVTADFSTNTLLATPGKSSLNQMSYDLNWEIQTRGRKWNEAPYMIKIDGKYYLSYSANNYEVIEYGVGYAVSDSPLGNFVKPHSYETENLLLGADPDDQMGSWDFMAGPGHHCFFYAGDELMIGYHAHTDRLYANSIRAFALDRVIMKDGKMIVNGPSYSLQPLPQSVSGYANVAKEATITADTTNDSALLNDGIIPMHMFNQEQIDLQAQFAKGSHTIIIDLAEEKEIAAIAVYNSLDYLTGIFSLDEVDIEDVGKTSNVKLNEDYIGSEWDEDYLRPGSAFIVELNPEKTKRITIKVSAKYDFALSDIVVLGR